MNEVVLQVDDGAARARRRFDEAWARPEWTERERKLLAVIRFLLSVFLGCAASAEQELEGTRDLKWRAEGGASIAAYAMREVLARLRDVPLKVSKYGLCFGRSGERAVRTELARLIALHPKWARQIDPDYFEPRVAHAGVRAHWRSGFTGRIRTGSKRLSPNRSKSGSATG